MLTLTGCGSDDDDDENKIGYFQVYNTSSTSPGIYLTVDQYDDDDYSESTHSAIEYTKAGGRYEYIKDDYDIELAWKDADYDLEIIYEDNVTIKKNVLNFIVIAENIQTPNIQIYEIPVRDDDEKSDDSDDEVFNLRFLNMHAESDSIDIYLSESDETFNEAELLGSGISYTEISDNNKIDVDSYVFYITAAGSNEVLYQSKEISFIYTSEYIFSVRDNKGAGSAPFVIDIISVSSATEFAAADSEAKFKVYNGIVEHELLPDYHSVMDLHIDGVDDTPEIPSLAFGQFSDFIQTNFGDYSVNLVTPAENTPIIENHLLTLNENSDKTVFFYLLEEDVDADGDGDVDEDGDGIVDEIEITANSLVVDNSQSESIYNHQINVVNLIDQNSDESEFSSITVYFVRNDEIIDTADKSVVVPFASPQEITLLNNTYKVYVIGKLNSSDIILNSQELILGEDSVDQFLILEKSADSSTGFKMTFTAQKT